MKKRIIAGAGFAALLATTVAFAHGGATGVVKERMDAMDAMGEAVKTLAAMMRGETKYNAETVRETAAVIDNHAGEAMTALFPEGSDGEPSEAKPAIWTDWQEFQALAGRLDILAAGLGAAADNGMMMQGGGTGTGGGMMGSGSGMMGGSSGMMGGNSMMGGGSAVPDAKELAQMPVDSVFHLVVQTCSSCHTKFRAEKN